MALLAKVFPSGSLHGPFLVDLLCLFLYLCL
jgi:hypothetical protein